MKIGHTQQAFTKLLLTQPLATEMELYLVPGIHMELICFGIRVAGIVGCSFVADNGRWCRLGMKYEFYAPGQAVR